ncbi:MAG: penicillin-binding transpeptidase domain-containing protein [Eubacteriales bacterium]|nr:penicillin-binding transpeptidase domain-containing protein [Eubacteriales bacterium]
MKRTMSRSTIALVLAVVFLLGLGLLGFKYLKDNDMWASQTYNYYLSSGRGLSNAGKITDRNGVVLAYSEEGSRLYHDDYSVRLSNLHSVGDDSFNIATALQTGHRAELVGHNMIFGYGLPGSLSPKGNMKLTTDSSVNAKVYEAFGGKNGACFVYNYKTGEVLCMVSTPSYDPMNVPEKLPEGAYLNNAISSTFTPGSIFKIVTTVAAYEYLPNAESMTFTCEGRKDFGGDDVTCLEHHGEITLEEAFAYSCNIAFADLATEVGAKNMQKTAEKLGITKSYEISEIDSAKGHYNVEKATKNELAWSGIGQYTDLVNPAQMAILCGAIADGGNTKLPKYIDGTASGRTGTLMSKETAGKMADIMRYTITDHYGDSMFGGLTVGAKTGTAEVGEGKEPNAWMVGYSSDEDYPLAFAVVVEEGGYGFYSAGPIARIAMIESAKSLGFEG